MLTNLKKKKKLFTRIELIIVIAIIAVLAAIAIPKFGEVRKSANMKSDIANAKTIANAATALLAEGRFTTNSSGGYENIDLSSTSDTNATELKKYLQNVPTPELKGTKFIVKINDGNVNVYSESVSDANQVYPEPTLTAAGSKGTNAWYPELGTPAVSQGSGSQSQ